MSFSDIACFYNLSVYGGILTYIGVVERNSGINLKISINKHLYSKPIIL